MWSEPITLTFADRAAWEALGLFTTHTFDIVELGESASEVEGVSEIEPGYKVIIRHIGELPEAIANHMSTVA